jgi:hypothetical protein
VQERAIAQTGRLEDIRNQSHTIKHYTPVGFEKRRAPSALFHGLRAYFEVCINNAKLTMSREGESAGVYMRDCCTSVQLSCCPLTSSAIRPEDTCWLHKSVV